MSTKRVRPSVRRARPGLTLIELVVVLAILVGLAGLLVPMMGNLLNQTRYATSADGTAEVAKALETYRASNGVYPADMDSLLRSDGTLYTVANNTDTNVGIWNGPMTAYYTAGQPFGTGLSGNWMSFSQAFATQVGSRLQYEVMDHDTVLTDPSSSGTLPRQVYSPGGYSTASLAMINTANTSFVSSLYPGRTTVPDGVTLIAMGVGPRCAAVGNLMQNAPTCSAQKPQYYGRFIAIFALSHANGNPPAKLLKVVDAVGQTSEESISDFKAAAKD